jgi:CubicO group peptidase (beta-lactamase class C family)
VLQLRDRGLLTLDDTVSQHLAWFGEAHLSADARRITIRHLLTHTSGLRFEAGAPGHAYWQSSDFPTSEEIIAAAAEVELIVPPDTVSKYSNQGFVLLGEIVEVVSGVPYEAYVQQQILDPLRMDSTSFGPQERLSDELAHGYGRSLPGSERREFETAQANALNAAAGLFSSVEDLAKFLRWQLRVAGGDDSDILAGQTLREMQRVSWLNSNWTAARGLGFEIIHGPDRDMIGHSGLFPGFQAAAYISPSENAGVIVLTNSYTSPLFSEVMEIRDRAFDWIVPLLEKTNGNVTTLLVPEEWNAFEGVFRLLERDYLVLPIDGQLRMFDPSATDPKAGSANLVPVSGDTFRIEGNDPHGEQVVFERAQSGSVIALHVADWGRAVRVAGVSPLSVE